MSKNRLTGEQGVVWSHGGVSLQGRGWTWTPTSWLLWTKILTTTTPTTCWTMTSSSKRTARAEPRTWSKTRRVGSPDFWTFVSSEFYLSHFFLFSLIEVRRMKMMTMSGRTQMRKATLTLRAGFRVRRARMAGATPESSSSRTRRRGVGSPSTR